MKVRLVISSIKEEKKNYLSRNLFNYLNPLYLHGKIFPWGMGLSIKGALDFPALFKNDLKLNLKKLFFIFIYNFYLKQVIY